MITYENKDKFGAPPLNEWRDVDANEVKAAVNMLASRTYRVFETMPDLEDLTDGEVAFVVSGGVTPPDPDLVNLVTALAPTPTFTGSELSSANVPGGASGNWDNAWNEIVSPNTTYENGTVIGASLTIPFVNRYIEVDLGANYRVKKLAMWGRNGNECVDEFELQARVNDGDFVTVLSGNLLRNDTMQYFDIETLSEYRIWRLMVLTNHNPGATSRVTFWDIRLLGDPIS